MIDAVGRDITYLRVSITDRCNLRCQYCMPDELPCIGHDNILRYEEILRICKAATLLGIHHFKVTGGEPLVRKGVLDFLRRLRELPDVESVSITTNGVLLEPMLPELVDMGVSSVNISLDTLKQDVYRELTGQDSLEVVLRSLEVAVTMGLRVKINCVPLAGVNDEELAALAALSERLPVDVRFIELMPTGAGRPFHGIPGESVRKRLQQRYPDMHPVREQRGFGPARYYQSHKIIGRIGFIDALTDHFCSGCNRVRLTSEGFLKLCLYHDDGISLRELIRRGATDDELLRATREAVLGKPDHHLFSERDTRGGIQKMSSIGG